MKNNKFISTLVASALMLTGNSAALAAPDQLILSKLVTDGTLPLCKTEEGKVTENSMAYTSNGVAPTWKFYSCYGGPRSFKAAVKTIVFIGSNGQRITVFDSGSNALNYVDLVTTQLDLVSNGQIAEITSAGTFTLQSVELLMDNRFEMNARATYNDGVNGARSCGTSSSRGFTYSSPMNNGAGTINGKPHDFWHSLGGYSSNVQGSVWTKIESFPFVPPGFTSTNSYWTDSNGNRISFGYSNAIEGDISESDSRWVKKVKMEVLDSSSSLAGYAFGGNSNAQDIRSTITLRTPLTLKARNKFNLDLKLNLSKMLAWSFFYKTSNETPHHDLSIGNSCQNLIIGPILLDIKKVAIKND
ncbi:hypothetical protein ICN10_06360 [Polynucleobacter sp. 86C-FISCH]|uniref:hypothetical protein n=1 Tax=Polynucleobacter sp. 86C-FISCH TaxID=2689101 RepID=UPI001C0B744B|nr:hypothetical protein [Polynucleobacter sp. 86C-FISCH]MBU3596023.1 hypothetical protein [Polynucleobacter sp. 86C-FISCH]